MKYLPIAAALLMIGCATANSTLFSSTAYPPTTEVKIYTDATTLTEPYIEIGFVEGKGGMSATKQQCLDKMIEEAKAAGADALIKLEFGDQQQFNRSTGTYDTPVARAVMIRYKSHM